MSGNYTYTKKVMNKSGYIVQFPNIDAPTSMLEGTATINPHAQSVVQEFPLGTKLVQGERVWRYAKNGAGNLTAGMVLQGAAGQHAEADDDIVVGAASVAGVYTATITSTANLAVAANYYKEGYLYINDEAGEGHAYKIREHAALAGTANTVFYLYDPIVVALSVASQAGLKKNPFDMLIVHGNSGGTGFTAGVATIVVTAAYFFWVQRGGPCAVVVQEAVTIGKSIVAGGQSGKANASVDNETSLRRLGIPMTPGIADTESCLVYLTLES